MNHQQTPKQLGYFFPAEWHPHTATWLSWPHKEASWPGKIHTVYHPYVQFIKAVSEDETICINVANAAMELFAKEHLSDQQVDLTKIKFFHHPTNDAWCRDHGPAFLINPVEKKIMGYKSKFEILKNEPQHSDVIKNEIRFISNKISQMQTDIQLWENNIGFFANSKSANILKQEFENKIENAK